MNADQYELIKLGASTWNQWRILNPDTEVDLREADLEHQNLRGVNLRGANLVGTRFREAELQSADFNGADLTLSDLGRSDLTDACFEKANLSNATIEKATAIRTNFRSALAVKIRSEGTNYSEADFTGAKLDNAWLIGSIFDRAILKRTSLTSAVTKRINANDVDFSGADLTNADFTSSRYMSANFDGATLNNTHLRDCDLTDASFKGIKSTGLRLQKSTLTNADFSSAELIEAKLNQALLKDAILREADLSQADLRGAKQYILDSSRTRDAIFSHNAPDHWSELLLKYTGYGFIWSLLGLLASLTPYFAKALYWVGVNKYQALIEQLSIGAATEHYRVYQLVLGMDRSGIYALVPILLFSYLVIRGVLTLFVAPMREAEERSGYCPEWRPKYENGDRRGIKRKAAYVRELFKAYEWLYRIHQIARVLWLFAVLAFFYNAYQWLSLPVWIVPR